MSAASSCSKMRSIPRPSSASATRSIRSRLKAEEFLRSRPDGRMGIAKADGITFTVHLVRLSQSASRVLGEPRLPGSLPRSHRPRRAPLLGSGRVQKARISEAVPMASGQRLHLHRAAGVPDLLDRSQRRDARQRLSMGDSRRPFARDAGASHCRSSVMCAAKRTVPKRSPFRCARAASSYFPR